MGEGRAGVGEGAEAGLVRRTVGAERSREGEPGGGQVVTGGFICIAATFALTVPPSPGSPRRQSLFLRNTFGRFRPRARCATLRPIARVVALSRSTRSRCRRVHQNTTVVPRTTTRAPRDIIAPPRTRT